MGGCVVAWLRGCVILGRSLLDGVSMSGMKSIVLVVLTWLLAWPVWAGAQTVVEPAAGRQQELVRLVRQDCGSCHGMTLKGGLGSPLRAQDLRDKPADGLVATILYGRPGTAMPPWQALLSEAEAAWIVDRLLAGFPEE
jgi:cytochrome c55X